MNKPIIIAAVLLLLLLLVMWIHTDNRMKAVKEFLQSKEFKKIAKAVILIAETAMDATGSEKMAMAMRLILEYIPEHISKYIDPEMLTAAIQEVFNMIAKTYRGHTVPQDMDI